MVARPSLTAIRKEVVIQTARSGGPGGQHVNKVETKVILKWNVIDSKVLNKEQRERLQASLGKRLTNAGDLLIAVDSQRSQLKNKTIAFKKLDRLVKKAFEKQKERKATKPSKSAIKKRLKAKKLNGEKKALRKPPKLE
jgi:ribosome-associated protein